MPVNAQRFLEDIRKAAAQQKRVTMQQAHSRTTAKREIQRVAAYIRVSTDSDDQENSYETQERYFTALLQHNPNWASAGVYADYGISGTSREKRTSYQRLLRHCKEEKIDRIVCKSISRFARNTSDFMAALNVLHEHHVAILFEKENLDTKDTTSDFVLTTLAAMAQEESRSISANVRWSNQKRFPKGYIRNYDLYGYCFVEGADSVELLDGEYPIRRLEIVEEEATVVRYIFSQVDKGTSYADIARTLNAKHVPEPNLRKSTTREDIECGWTGAVISGMLGQERYCGDVLIQKTYTPDFLTHCSIKNKGQLPKYLVRDHHPAIIDRALFQRVQIIRRMNANRFKNKGREKTQYAFSGRLTCAYCGRHYNVRNTKHHPIWFCPTSALNNGTYACRAEKIYEEQIVRMFRRAFIDRFGLLPEPVLDDVTVADIMSGRYGQDENAFCRFTKQADDFVTQVRKRLENVQKTDHMERDRSFLKRQINLQQAIITETEKRIRKLASQKDVLETRKTLLGDVTITQGEIDSLAERLEAESMYLQEAKAECSKLEQRLSELEIYWERIENDHEEREKALEWMQTLPKGREGTVAFLNGLTCEYVRAFALEITVHDPLHYTVHWFDDTQTAVEMYSNVEDFRYTSDYYDGQCMRRKYRK